MSMKNPLTPAGIEPATFRFVAQHLNHCATPCLRMDYEYSYRCVGNTVFKSAITIYFDGVLYAR